MTGLMQVKNAARLPTTFNIRWVCSKKSKHHIFYLLSSSQKKKDENSECQEKQPKYEACHLYNNQNLSGSIKETDSASASRNSWFDSVYFDEVEINNNKGERHGLIEDLIDIEDVAVSIEENSKFATVAEIVPLERFKKKGKLSVTGNFL